MPDSLPDAEQLAIHWEAVYEASSPDAVSWYQSEPTASLELIDTLGVDPNAAVIDVGGGASILLDRLLTRRFTDLSVLDISEAARGNDRALWSGDSWLNVARPCPTSRSKATCQSGKSGVACSHSTKVASSHQSSTLPIMPRWGSALTNTIMESRSLQAVRVQQTSLASGNTPVPRVARRVGGLLVRSRGSLETFPSVLRAAEAKPSYDYAH